MPAEPVEFETEQHVDIHQGGDAIRWPDEVRQQLLKHGVIIFKKSKISEKFPDVRPWIEKHFFPLGTGVKQCFGRYDRADPGAEHVSLENKQVIHFSADYCRQTNDSRVRSCFDVLRTHALQCLSVLAAPSSKNINSEEADALVMAFNLAKESTDNVLSAFVYKADTPAGSVICDDHVDRGFVTAVTNQDGGLEVFLDGSWVALPPTPGIVCFAGYAMHHLRSEVPMIRHRVVSTGPESRVSIAFKLRPDMLKMMRMRTDTYKTLLSTMSNFDIHFRSVNQPEILYQNLTPRVASTSVSVPEASSLTPSGFIEHCIQNRLPWQLKGPEQTWSEFCMGWATKVRGWEQKTFDLHMISTRSRNFQQPCEILQTKQLNWNDLITDCDMARDNSFFVDDLLVATRPFEIYPNQIGRLRDPHKFGRARRPVDVDEHGLVLVVKMFKEFIPRWGEVFELYRMQTGSIIGPQEPVKHVVYIPKLRGD